MGSGEALCSRFCVLRKGLGGNGVRLRYFVILLLRPWTAFFSGQLYDKVPREVNSWLPRHSRRLPKKGRPVNT
jgi:hypothetical protein